MSNVSRPIADLIKANWKNLNDAQMAQLLGTTEREVGKQRRALDLKRKRGAKPGISSGGFKSKITSQALAHLLNVQGKTQKEVAKDYGITRSRVQQVCKGWGITIKRTPEWYARHYGEPKLSDRAWLAGQLNQWQGVSRLAAQTGLAGITIMVQVRRLGLNPVYRAKLVKRRCAFCSKVIEIKESHAKRHPRSFCDKYCQGKWLAEARHSRHSARMEGVILS